MEVVMQNGDHDTSLRSN